jgi:SAM-dependent methyltransferase
MTANDGYDAQRWRDFEHDGWQTVANHYHAWLGSVTASAVGRLLDAVGAQPSVRLLDIATGPGYGAAMAAERGADVVGMDFSAAMVEEAAGRFAGIEFREGDAEALPFADESFEAIISNFGFLHFAHPDHALAEACRVLRRGGRFAFTVWDTSPDTDPRQIVRYALQAHGDTTVELPAAPPDLFDDPTLCAQALQRAGFVEPVVTKLPLTQPMPDPDAYFDLQLHGAGPRVGSPLRAQPPAALALIRQAVRDRLQKLQQAGVTELPSPALLISASKP